MTLQRMYHPEADKPDIRLIFLSYGIALCAMLAWNFHAGKDMNWDVYNYHYYLPHSLIEGRLSQDFFAGSLASYLNPVPFLPFYLFNRLGLSSLQTASLLTVIHSLNYLALILLLHALRVFQDRRVLPYFIAATLALISPIFMQSVGSSFVEATVSMPFLFGLYFFLKSTKAKDWFLAGFLLSSAVAMKFVLLLFIPPLIAFLPACKHSLNRNNLSALVLGGVAGLTLFGGWWFWLIWQQFGNPVFPFFNGIFQSSLLPLENIKDYKFLPSDSLAAWTLPVRMLDLNSYVYVETSAPDLRILSFFLLLPLFFIGRYFSGRICITKPQVCFLIYLILCYLFWVWFSGNGRYGLIFLLLTGVGLAILLANSGGIRRFYFYAPLLIIMQASLFLWQGSYRWASREWTDDWFDVINVPSEHANHPALYLSTGRSTGSFWAPYFHPEAKFISLNGMYSIGRHSDAGKKILDMIHNHNGDIKTIHFQFVPWKQTGKPPFAKIVKALAMKREIFHEYDLELMPASCHSLRLGDDAVPSEFTLICDLIKKPAPPEYQQERTRINELFARIESLCPQLPTLGARPVRIGRSWKKYYFSHNLTLTTNESFIIANQPGARAPVHIAIDDVSTMADQSCPLDELEHISVPFFDRFSRQ